MNETEMKELIAEGIKSAALQATRACLEQVKAERVKAKADKAKILNFLKSMEKNLSLYSRLIATELIASDVPTDYIKAYITDAVLRGMAPITEVQQ